MSGAPIRLLLAWSDYTDPHPQLFIIRPWEDRSPVLRLLGLRESEGRYHAAMLLAPNGEKERAEKLAEAMRSTIAKVEVVPVPVETGANLSFHRLVLACSALKNETPECSARATCVTPKLA